MARADLLVSIVAAARRGDRQLLQRSVEALAAEERAIQHHVLADRLEEALHRNGASAAGESASSDLDNLLSATTPRRSLRDLVLVPSVVRSCLQLIEEQQRSDLLRSRALEPRSRILLVGPAGNGKTSLAEAIAEALLLEMYTIRYEGVIGSFLGETAARLRRIFDFVRSRRCLLLIDEFDAIAKERGDIHETGEIKRVVSSLLLQIDSLPSYVVVVAATNHSELLDRATWRRFQLRLELPAPTLPAIEEWLRRFEARTEFRWARPVERLAIELKGASFAEIEEFATEVLRRSVLAESSPVPPTRIVTDVLTEWRARVTPGKL
jgi:AAA+ superfamily predicted ATPase